MHSIMARVSHLMQSSAVVFDLSSTLCSATMLPSLRFISGDAEHGLVCS